MIFQFSARFRLAIRFISVVGVVVSLRPLSAQDTIPVPNSDPAQGTILTVESGDRSIEKSDVPHLADPQTLAEIKAIRQRLGGSVTQQLSELFDEASDKSGLNPLESEQEFDRTVERLASSEREAAVIPNAASTPTSIQARLAKISPAQGEPAQGEPAQGARERMRAAARLLEQAAAELELASRFAEADSVRQTAGQLWLLTRPSSPTVRSTN